MSKLVFRNNASDDLDVSLTGPDAPNYGVADTEFWLNGTGAPGA